MAERRIFYVTATRTDYGLIRNTLTEIHNHPKLSLLLIATGVHLMHEYGYTINEIKKDIFRYRIINAVFKDNTNHGTVGFIQKLIKELNCLFSFSKKPDIILLVGDRPEVLAIAVVAVYLRIPIAHIHGGEITSTVDETARHAITKLSHIHFATTAQHARRIIKLGEDKNNVFVVGAPGLDNLSIGLLDAACLEQQFHIDLSKKLLLVLQHPVTDDVSDPANQITQTLEAVKGLQAIIFYPNSDPGSKQMIDVIKRYNTEFRIIKTVSHITFLSLMRYASILIGNSSAGIIESASFGLSVINIGHRQNGRQQANNVLNVPYDKVKIKSAIHYLINLPRKKYHNPYGNGNTGKKIADILSSINLDGILNKKIKY